jgi:hypothetical protein
MADFRYPKRKQVARRYVALVRHDRPPSNQHMGPGADARGAVSAAAGVAPMPYAGRRG